jgi:hypothetical protein
MCLQFLLLQCSMTLPVSWYDVDPAARVMGWTHTQTEHHKTEFSPEGCNAAWPALDKPRTHKAMQIFV